MVVLFQEISIPTSIKMFGNAKGEGRGIKELKPRFLKEV